MLNGLGVRRSSGSCHCHIAQQGKDLLKTKSLQTMCGKDYLRFNVYMYHHFGQPGLVIAFLLWYGKHLLRCSKCTSTVHSIDLLQLCCFQLPMYIHLQTMCGKDYLRFDTYMYHLFGQSDLAITCLLWYGKHQRRCNKCTSKVYSVDLLQLCCF